MTREKGDNVSVTSNASAKAVEARLPKLELPCFSGDVTTWTSFWEQFVAVWLLRNLSLDGELCLRDGKNSAILYKFTISRRRRRAWKTSGYRRAHKQEAVSGWLNPHSLGTLSAFGCIENLADSSICLINYQDVTRSIQIFLV